MRAYVQTVKKDNATYLGMEQSAHWFEQRGYEIVRFDFDEIALGRLDDDLLHHAEDTVVRGGVGAVREALLRAGRPTPPNIDLPKSLSLWIGRRIWHTTMGQVRAAVKTEDFTPIHIKPLLQHKLFSGVVVRAFRDLIPMASVSAEVPLLAQEYVDFVSEWRVAILRDKILHVGNYRGDPLVFPDANVIRSSIESFDDRPMGFGMDWGITSDGRTLLVEVNDGYALGNYGIPGAAYTALIEARWRQLMGLADKT
jgi:hypothetical protein